MNKLYYLALSLGLALSLHQSPSYAQAWQDTDPTQSGANASTNTGWLNTGATQSPANANSNQPWSGTGVVNSSQTLNGGGQQAFLTGQQTPPVPPVYQGGMAQGSAAGQGTVPYGGYTFGFTGGAPSGHGGYPGLPPTSLGSCNGINILGGGGGLSTGTAAGGIIIDIDPSTGGSTWTVPGTGTGSGSVTFTPPSGSSGGGITNITTP